MLSTLKSGLKVSLISLILIFSLTEVSDAHPDPSYAHDGGRQTCQPCWMKYLKNDVRLSQLSIPGTHESLSFYGGVGVPRDMVKTQSMALKFQLESGIRVFDVRCAIVGNSFNIYHGNFYQHENFHNVLKTVVEFLKKHPSETVLMRVKEERTDDPDRFAHIFRTVYWNNKDYKDYMWNAWEGTPENPTLGEMRGKIVILQDFARWQCISPLPNPEFGICYFSFNIQDEFKVASNWSLYNKWLFVKAHLDAANKDANKPCDEDEPCNKDKKYMNYLSASGGSFPYFVVSGHSNPATGAPRLGTGLTHANNPNLWRPVFPRMVGPCPILPVNCIYFEGTNTLTYAALGTYYKHRVGIIMTDFPGWGLINRTIDLNKPFWKDPTRPNECSENVPGKCGQPSRRSK